MTIVIGWIVGLAFGCWLSAKLTRWFGDLAAVLFWAGYGLCLLLVSVERGDWFGITIGAVVVVLCSLSAYKQRVPAS